MAYGLSGMRIVDLSDPPNPRVRATLALPQAYPVQRVSVGGDRAYVACDAAGFAVVDLTSPDAPEVVLPTRRRMRISFP